MLFLFVAQNLSENILSLFEECSKYSEKVDLNDVNFGKTITRQKMADRFYKIYNWVALKLSKQKPKKL